MSHQLLEKMKTIKLILDYMPDVFLSKNWFKSSIKTGDSIYINYEADRFHPFRVECESLIEY